MATIVNGIITCNFSISAKDSAGNFTISATFTNTDSNTNVSNVHLSCSLTNGSPWSRIDVGTVNHGQSKSGSVTISSGNQGSQNVYCYCITGSSSTGPGGAYSVPAYNPPTPTYYNHTLTFNANGDNVVDLPNTITFRNTSYNLSTTLPATAPSRNGYTFLGYWTSTTPSASDTLYQPNTQYTFSTTNVNLYAIWLNNPCTFAINQVGSGTLLVNGVTPLLSYNKGEIISITIMPSSNYYLQQLTALVDGVETTLYSSHTIKRQTIDYTIQGDTILNVYFIERQSHTLSVSSEYQISGTGTYLYLDNPTLVCDFSGNLVLFDGWFENGEKLSSANPYTFTMPDRDVSLTVQTGGEIFSNLGVRQFALQNGKGEVYRLTSKNSKIFLNNPKGLGYSVKITTSRVGNSEIVNDRKPNMPQPMGELIFHRDTISGKYKDYYDFIRFVSNLPITLWQKIPANIENNIYHIPVEIINIAKEEVKEDNCLHVPISFYGLNFWQSSEINTGTSAIVLNDGDFPVGVKINVSLIHSTQFVNPKIVFSQNDEIYGGFAIQKQSPLTKVEIDTRDDKQSITLYNGDEIIANPFAYVDTSFGGDKEFPFPKLRQGYTTIDFIYDDEDSTDKVYVIEYEKEYLSV